MLNFKEWLMNESRGIRLSPEVIKAIDDNIDEIYKAIKTFRKLDLTLGTFFSPAVAMDKKKSLPSQPKFMQPLYDYLKEKINTIPNLTIQIQNLFVPNAKTDNTLKDVTHKIHYGLMAGAWANPTRRADALHDSYKKDSEEIKSIIKKIYDNIKSYEFKDKNIINRDTDEQILDFIKTKMATREMADEYKKLSNQNIPDEEIDQIFKRKYNMGIANFLNYGWAFKHKKDDPAYDVKIKNQIEATKNRIMSIKEKELADAGFEGVDIPSIKSFEKFFDRFALLAIKNVYTPLICDTSFNRIQMLIGSNTGLLRKDLIRSVLIHEIIHCFDQYPNRPKDPAFQKTSTLGRIGDKLSRSLGGRSYYAEPMEIEAHIGEMVQAILEVPEKYKDPTTAKKALDSAAEFIKKPSLIKSGLGWLTNKFTSAKNPVLKSWDYLYKIYMYLSMLPPNIRKVFLKRLDRAIQDAREILKKKST